MVHMIHHCPVNERGYRDIRACICLDYVTLEGAKRPNDEWSQMLRTRLKV